MIFRSSIRGVRVIAALVLGCCALVGAAGCSQQATSEQERPQGGSAQAAAADGAHASDATRAQAKALERPASPYVAGHASGDGSGEQPAGSLVQHDASPATRLGDPAGAGKSAALPTVVFLGDSLTAGLGVSQDLAFPALLAERLGRDGAPVHVINAGVSGDTTAGGLSRLEWLLRQKPDVVVVELGANDGLRALPLEEIRTNLKQIISRARASGARVLLLGMLIPTNYGPDYSSGFARNFPAIAKELQVPLVPFLLDGVAGRADLNQEDGIHPTAEGHKRLADNVFPYLRQILKEAGRG